MSLFRTGPLLGRRRLCCVGCLFRVVGVIDFVLSGLVGLHCRGVDGTSHVVVMPSGTSPFTVFYTPLPPPFAWCQIACNLARA